MAKASNFLNLIEHEPDMKTTLDANDLWLLGRVDPEYQYELQQKLDWKFLQHNKGVLIRDLLRIAFNFSLLETDVKHKEVDLGKLLINLNRNLSKRKEEE